MEATLKLHSAHPVTFYIRCLFKGYIYIYIYTYYYEYYPTVTEWAVNAGNPPCLAARSAGAFALVDGGCFGHLQILQSLDYLQTLNP